MNISTEELGSVLSSFNPWWRGESITDLPKWRRSAFNELLAWTYEPPVSRAVLVSGARQVGKTTLLLHVIDSLLKKGVSPGNILYVTFDHPLIKLAGVDAVLEAWREREPKISGEEYLFLDEAQFVNNWNTWIKHQVDFNKGRRIIYTGSAMPLLLTEPESAVGRIHTISITTLSFYEYMQLKDFSLKEKMNKTISWIENHDFKTYIKNMHIENEAKIISKIKDIDFKATVNNYKNLILPEMFKLKNLEDLFNLSQKDIYNISELSAPYLGHFHNYLIQGGFPQTAQVEGIAQAQRLIREDIIDKVLKRDMTALFGVRRVLDLEQIFLYLCMHDGGLLNINALSQNLDGVSRQTVQNYIDLLESAHLIYKLQPFGYGKEILRAKYKIYLADSCIAPSVLLMGKDVLNNSTKLGSMVETTLFKHIYSHFNAIGARLTYWHTNGEVDLIVEQEGTIIPFEIKYRAQAKSLDDLKGLLNLCKTRNVKRAYVITKSLDDFGLLENTGLSNTQIMRVPAPLFCYWLGVMEKNFSDGA